MKINSKVVSDRFDDEVVVVNLDSGVYYSFRNAAMEIWTGLEKGLSASSVLKVFNNLTEEQEKAANVFLEFLVSENLLTPGDDSHLEHPDTTIEFVNPEFQKFEDMADLIVIDPIHEVDNKKGWPHKPE
jgi:hypothetical protein